MPICTACRRCPSVRPPRVKGRHTAQHNTGQIALRFCLSLALRTNPSPVMSGSANGASGERGKEYQCLLMHPSASIVQGCNHFYPYGECSLYTMYTWRRAPRYSSAGIMSHAESQHHPRLECRDRRHLTLTCTSPTINTAAEAEANNSAGL